MQPISIITLRVRRLACMLASGADLINSTMATCEGKSQRKVTSLRAKRCAACSKASRSTHRSLCTVQWACSPRAGNGAAGSCCALVNGALGRAKLIRKRRGRPGNLCLDVRKHARPRPPTQNSLASVAILRGLTRRWQRWVRATSAEASPNASDATRKHNHFAWRRGKHQRQRCNARAQ